MDNKEFIKNCEIVVAQILTCWGNGVKCYETNGKKQFYLESNHSWGTAYCDWSKDKCKIFEALKSVGATNISGKVEWNCVRLYFNKRKRPIKM